MYIHVHTYLYLYSGKVQLSRSDITRFRKLLTFQVRPLTALRPPSGSPFGLFGVPFGVPNRSGNCSAAENTTFTEPS